MSRLKQISDQQLRTALLNHIQAYPFKPIGMVITTFRAKRNWTAVHGMLQDLIREGEIRVCQDGAQKRLVRVLDKFMEQQT